MPDVARATIVDQTWQRLGIAAAVMAAVIAVGAGGYHLLGSGRWSAVECLYMAVITISTVGYAETLSGLHQVPGAIAWTMVLIVLGSGTMLYFASSLTALIVEGDIGGAVRRRRMQDRIDALEGHLIICGAGSTGRHVLHGLRRDQVPIVLIDHDPEHLRQAREEFPRPLYVVEGDATEDAVLHRAGLERASGLVLALTEDRDNVYAAVTARALAARVRIVAKAVEPGAEAKLLRAGADEVVSPSKLGGQRLAAQLLRPSVVDFFSRLVIGDEGGSTLEEVLVPARGPQVGRSLGELRLREHVDVLVVGIRAPGGHWVTRPGAETRLTDGASLIVIGEPAEIVRLRQLLERGA